MDFFELESVSALFLATKIRTLVHMNHLFLVLCYSSCMHIFSAHILHILVITVKGGERWSHGRAPDCQLSGWWFNSTCLHFET